jgi:hypothetical protein
MFIWLYLDPSDPKYMNVSSVMAQIIQSWLGILVYHEVVAEEFLGISSAKKKATRFIRNFWFLIRTCWIFR